MEHQVEEIKTRSRLNDALESLDPEARRLMELWLDGRSRSEIAAELGLSADAVATMYSAAFSQVQSLLAR